MELCVQSCLDQNPKQALCVCVYRDEQTDFTTLMQIQNKLEK